MPRAVALGIGLAAGGLVIRERRFRIRAERLGAATLETLLATIDANDAVTGAHVRRVADYALILAEAAELDERKRRSVERVALFHDIGKIHEAINDIFHDRSRLTPSEWRAVMTHPRRGADVLEPLRPFYPDLAEGVLSHHERWDGTGYPRQLKGRRIPMTARVVALADTFDAVTHERRYSQARSIAEATKVLLEGRGTQFDPDLVDLFVSPPVMDLIGARMAAKERPAGKHHRRSNKLISDSVPDLKFRWRSGAAARPRQGRSSRKPPR
ncbi:MAG TPA: HD domain-containing phosphohydrolase [Gemmatimonadaceae bacterium]|nr:HD domain-containing phosphohydrolase [Gemmatimonadaceae bacterium]